MNQYYAAEMKWMSALMPIMFEFYAVAARQKEVREFLKEYFQDYRSVLSALIQRGIDRGEFRAVNVESVAITLAALYEGLTLLWIVDPQVVQWEKAGEASVLLLLDGLTAHKE